MKENQRLEEKIIELQEYITEKDKEVIKYNIEIINTEKEESLKYERAKKRIEKLLKNLIERNKGKEENGRYIIEEKEEENKERKTVLNPFTETKFFEMVNIDGKRIINNMNEVDLSVPIFSYQDISGLLIESFRKIETLRKESDLNIRKKKKMEDLFQIFEALTEYQSINLTVEKVVEQKLTQTLDAFVSEFGGISFIAPLNIKDNSNIGAKEKIELIDVDKLDFIR
jgi:hypothetical protein